jgi:hypothetical protein
MMPIGLISIAGWHQLLTKARKNGAFVGVDEKAYPRDFAVLARYYFDLQRKIHLRYPMRALLRLNRLDQSLKETRGDYPVQWL